MTIALIACAILMALIATIFATSPLLKRQSVSERGSIQLPLLVAILLVLGSIIGYAASGGPADISVSQADTSMPAWPAPSSSPETGTSAGSVSSLLVGLEQRLAQEPGDGKGWLLLAKSYDHLGRTEDARVAYEKAAALGVTDESFGSGLVAPNAGTDSSEIRGRVNVAPDIAGDIDPNDVVFVVAKPVDGNPMPLAVIRRPGRDLPFEFVLDESTSMAGGGLAGNEAVRIHVKVSRSGDALNTVTSLKAEANNVRVGTSEIVDLVISRTE